jgi:hypothetical protein
MCTKPVVEAVGRCSLCMLVELLMANYFHLISFYILYPGLQFSTVEYIEIDDIDVYNLF